MQNRINFENIICPRCGVRENQIVAKGRDYLHNIEGLFTCVECTKCGLHFQNPSPKEETISELYPPNYGPHSSSSKTFKKSNIKTNVKTFFMILFSRYKKRVSLIPDFVKDGCVLEIGCADGKGLTSLYEQGWRTIEGVELVNEAAAKAREKGFIVYTGDVKTVLENIDDEKYDAIIASMVIEHLKNPFEVFRLVHQKLKPNGQLLFSTISKDSFDYKLFNEFWAGYDFPRHLVYFSKEDLRLATEGKFTKLRITHQIMPIDFIRSATWRNGRKDKFLVKFFKSPLGYATCAIFAIFKSSTRISCQCFKETTRSESL